ncbi:ABC transporter permease subunit [Gracilimonas sp.]|uniref:ABC transporter permease subunit n=1 Tax=Gracilimonas sp. TaxID=1974203 RepID=UPI002871AFED|nr:ABC transporter permease subunit [Gracilimonas sp.]
MPKKLIIALFISLILLPLGLALGYSFLYSIGAVGLLSDGLTLDHWVELFRGEFLSSILYSLWIAMVSASIALFLALIFLFTLRNHFEKPGTYRLLFLPLTIPPIVVGFIIFQMYSGSGILSRLFYHLGIVSGTQEFPVMVQDPYGIGIILAHIFIVFPFFLLVLLNVYKNENLAEIERVARSLGAYRNTIIWKLHLPILMRGIFPLFILYIIFFMGAYDIPLLLGQSSPQMISVLILEKLQRFNLGDIPVAYSMAVWYALICIATISYLLMKYRKKEAL